VVKCKRGGTEVKIHTNVDLGKLSAEGSPAYKLSAIQVDIRRLRIQAGDLGESFNPCGC
jgi:hypothetical protein